MPLQLRFIAIARTQCGSIFLYWTAFCPKAGHKKESLKDFFSYEIDNQTNNSFGIQRKLKLVNSSFEFADELEKHSTSFQH